MTGTMPILYPLTLANDSAPLWDFHIEPQAVVINLGTNDISNSKGDPGQPFQDAYLGLVQTVRAKYPHAYIVCIIGPLLSGGDLQTIEGYIQAVVDTLNAAGDARVEFFNQIAPQPTSAAACQYHPDAAEQTADRQSAGGGAPGEARLVTSGAALRGVSRPTLS